MGDEAEALAGQIRKGLDAGIGGCGDDQGLVVQHGQRQAVLGQAHVGAHHREVGAAGLKRRGAVAHVVVRYDFEAYILAGAGERVGIGLDQVGLDPVAGPDRDPQGRRPRQVQDRAGHRAQGEGDQKEEGFTLVQKRRHHPSHGPGADASAGTEAIRDGADEPGRDGALRAARPITPAYLERAALYYLERYGASAEMVRRVLRRRVETRCRLRGEAPDDFSEMIEAVVARALGAGLVDDAAFAAAKVRSLRRRGGSARAIGAKLAAKGVDRETVGAVLAEQEDGSEDEAALAYAKRRRLGPFRPPAARAAARERDLAAMARAGFALALARRVIDAETEDELREG